ncbi:tetratricopeptide repeat protein [Stieleria marina]|uniref:Lipoprotein NlpI n=1 Tax=Stieleria marina TaxID=1930275 RepID=A0A517NPL7_9BACT|nr:lipoprotein NlpI [Planctomycetes bacterium K23_9]
MFSQVKLQFAIACIVATMTTSVTHAQDGYLFGGVAAGGLSQGLPLGIPPSPGDTRMLSVPPDDVGAYVTWSRVVAPQANSKNRTERLLAEPEIQALFGHVMKNYRDAAIRVGKKDPSAGAIAVIGSQFLNAILSHETALYLRINEGSLAGGLVCDLGEDAGQLNLALRSLAKMSGDQLVPSVLETLDVYSFKDAPLPAQVTIGNRFMILAVGENELATIISRLKTPAGGQTSVASWLKTARKQVDVPRLANLSFVNVQHFAKALNGGSQMPPELAALDIDGLRSMVCATGLDENGIVVRTHFDCDDALLNKLKQWGGTLQDSDAALVPADATLWSALKYNAMATTESAMQAFELIEPGANEQIEEFVREATGVDLREELIPALGDSIQFYSSPSEGGRLLTGWTGAIKLNDQSVFEKAIEKLQGRLAEAGVPFRIQSREVSGKTVSYLTNQRPQGRYRRGPGLGLVPAWCLDDNRLIVSTFPQNIYALLDRTSQSDNTKPVFGDDHLSGAARIQLNEKAIAEIAYPFLQIGAALAISELDDDLTQLVEIDYGFLPSLPTVTKHMSAASLTVQLDDGIDLVRRQTLPPTGAATVVMGVLIADPLDDLITASIDKSNPVRAVSRQMRNLLFAIQDHNDFNGGLPTDIRSAEGKRLLSWRVELLPMLGEQSLYEQFKRDQPWDSPANRPLINKMPGVFRSIDTKEAIGKTSYLAVRHPKSSMPSDQKLNMKRFDFKKGETVMLLEASDAEAVEWTKPQDLTYQDGSNLSLHLRQRDQGLVIGFANGAVKTVSVPISTEGWATLVKREESDFVPVTDKQTESKPDEDAAPAALPTAATRDESTEMPVDAAIGNSLPAMTLLNPIPIGSPLANESSLARAKELEKAGKFWEAIIEYTKVTVADPNHFRANLGLAGAKYELKQYKEAEEAFAKCIQLQPKDHRSYLGHGMSVWVQDRNEDSLPFFEQAFKIEPASAKAWLYHGLANNSLGNHEQAIASLTKSLDLDPAQWLGTYMRANAYYALKRNPEAIVDYSKAIQLQPKSSEPYLYRAFVYRRLGESKKAIADFTSRLKSNPLDKTALEYRGDEYLANGQPKLAVRDYDSLIGLDPDHVAALRGRGSALIDMEDYEQSVAAYTRVIAMEPTKYDFANRAIGWKELDRFDNAVDDYTSALKLDPKYGYALTWRASAYMTLKRFTLSKADFESAVAVVGEDDSDLLGNFSWLLAACPDDQIRDGQLALKYATKASEATEWKEAWIIDNVAAAHAELGNFKEAIRFAQKAMEVATSDSVRDDIKTRLTEYQSNKPARF